MQYQSRPSTASLAWQKPLGYTQKMAKASITCASPISFSSPLSWNAYLHFSPAQSESLSFGDIKNLPQIHRKYTADRSQPDHLLEVNCMIQLIEAVEGLRNYVPSSGGVHRGRVQGPVGSALKGLITTDTWGRGWF